MASVSPQERLGLKLSFWSSGATGCGQGARHPRVTDEPAEAAAYQQGDTHGPVGGGGREGGLPVLLLSCAAGGTDRWCPRPDQLLPGVEGDLLPGPGCRDPGPQLCGGSEGVGCGGRAEEGRSIASARRGPGAGMRLPKQEVSGEGAGQESRGQRGGRDSSGTRLGRPGSALTVCTPPEAGLVWRRGPRLASEPGCGLSAGGRRGWGPGWPARRTLRPWARRAGVRRVSSICSWAGLPVRA